MFRLLFGILAVLPTHAQDTRRVTEPVFPPSCAVLTARLAEVDEAQPDSRRIQQALDTCAPGRAVELRADGARAAFLSGPLDLRAGVTLRIGAGATLFASRNPRDYDVSPGRCGTVDQSGRGCRALINGDHAAGAAVMGEGMIDGRGGAHLLGQNFSWWDLAEKARAGGNQNCPRLIVLSHSDDFTLYRVTLKNSPNFHVYYGDGNGFTAWGVVIDTPRNARNTDGIDPAASTNITITHCFHTGDDNVAIKAGGPTSHITVAHNHFYAGHGMSIGSETYGGAQAIRVTDLSIDGADNGIRIKSNSTRGGLVRDVVYEDLCIRDTKNPILMDTHYTASYGPDRNRMPEFTNIVLRNVRISGSGKITLDGYDESHRLDMTFDNVHLDAPSTLRWLIGHAQLTLGPGPVNFHPCGPDVTLQNVPGHAMPNACSNKFLPMPGRAGSDRPGR
jgi:polygalacturonase